MANVGPIKNPAPAHRKKDQCVKVRRATLMRKIWADYDAQGCSV